MKFGFNIIGDNLGLHSILGFTESFMSNYPCRFCKCSKFECNYETVQNNDKLRNEDNYKSDLAMNNNSLSGIKEIYTLNNRIQCFNYGPVENQNRPPFLSVEFLKTNKIKMSATEMLCFTRHLGLLIGDLVPTDSEI
ncbi:Uncharacterized protein FWK35_00006348 [Aphis craccivora]|uniref:Uncharacterized protein n=1 Tax=Aphis craccivora TaxID=307492 RepID=A0A6G0ZG96_APHCR|nr:Uncharacterized protein FWK35_00006348 [Aphis craccivora]